jgi:hypothetical protein
MLDARAPEAPSRGDVPRCRALGEPGFAVVRLDVTASDLKQTTGRVREKPDAARIAARYD